MKETKGLAWGVFIGVGLLGCGGGADSPQSATTLGSTTGTPGPGSTGPQTGGEPEPVCVPGTQNSCMCTGGRQGFQVCNAEGAGFDPCMCEDDSGSDDSTGDDPTAADSSTGPADPCGNEVCEAELDEDCSTCEVDCGVCEPCDQAPSCEGAAVPPPIDTHAGFLDDPMAYVTKPEIADTLVQAVQEGSLGARLIAAALSEPGVDEPEFVGVLRATFEQHPIAIDAVRRQFAAAGMSDPQGYVMAHAMPTQAELSALAPTSAASPANAASVDGFTHPLDPMTAPCDDPRMRIRVARLTVHEEDDDFFNDEIYCAITSEAPEHAELKVTPLTTALDEGDSVDFNLDAGLIWGQSELTAPGGNVLITYTCIESEGSGEGYANLLGAIGDAVGDFDGKSVGADGWVFPAAGVVTNLLAGSLTLDGDDLLFNGSQTIAADQMLSLVYGAWWSVRREGTNLNSDWDWELRMEIWGCHDYGTGTGPVPE